MSARTELRIEERADARRILVSIGAEIGQDFHTLRSSQVDHLLMLANLRRYRAPKNANGSRGLYFYKLTQRRATR